MRIPFCKLDFRQFSATGLDTFSQLVLAGIYLNAIIFGAPPVTEADYIIIRNKFVDAFVEYTKYGAVKKTEFENAKKALVEMLNTLAAYVNSVALGDASKIILSGFEPSKAMPQPTADLVQPSNFTVKRSENTGEIIVTIAPVVNYGIVNYGCICVQGKPLDDLSIVNGQVVFPDGSPSVRFDINKSRRKVFSSLTVGETYFFYVFAINSASVSPLSDVRKLMAA